MIVFRYKNKVKKVNLDRYATIEDVLQVVSNLFSIKTRIIGFQDLEGSFFDFTSFMQNLHHFQGNQKIATILTDDQGQRNSSQNTYGTKYNNMNQMVNEVLEQDIQRNDSTSKRKTIDQQSSLKYSQVSECTSQIGFIDFIYDLDEFQSLLIGENYTTILMVDENDPQLADFLGSLETLIQHYSQSTNFYYSYLNRLGKSAINKVAWFYKGSKKILQLVLNSPQKMKQFEELLQKIHQSKTQGKMISQHTSPEPQPSRHNHQQTISNYDQQFMNTNPHNINNHNNINTNNNNNHNNHANTNNSMDQNRRSKSIKRLVESSSQNRNQSQNMYENQTQQSWYQKGRQNSVQRYQTHIQGVIVPNYTECFQTDRNENNTNERQSNRPQTAAPSRQYQELNIQDQYIQLANELEMRNQLDIQSARLVKRLILEENKLILMVLNGYLENMYDDNTLCDKLLQFIERNEQDYQRPQTPSQQKNPAQNYRKEKSIQKQYQQKEIPVADFNIEQIRKDVFEINMGQFSPEEYGMGMYLLHTLPDPLLITLIRDAHQKMIQYRQAINLVAIITYVKGKFNEVISNSFNYNEQLIINEHKSKRTSSVYAIFQCFRYECNLEDFIESLKKAIQSLIIISSNSSSSINHNVQKNQQLTQQQNQLSRSPIKIQPQGLVLSMSPTHSLSKSDRQSRQAPLPGQKFSHDDKRSEVSPKQEINSLFSNNNKNNIQPNVPMNDTNQIQVTQLSDDKPKLIAKKKKEFRTANEEIFSEEEFMRSKNLKRRENMINIDNFYNSQKEDDIVKIFAEILNKIDLGDDSKNIKIKTLMERYDSKLYDILKNFSSFRSISQTKTDLIKLLSQEDEDINYLQDYRKVKMFNLFKNQVRQFTIQKHLLEIEKNYLLKLFLEDDLQVLGSLEAYLANGDAQDMLDTLRTIVQQYSKFINIQTTDLQGHLDSHRDSKEKIQPDVKFQISPQQQQAQNLSDILQESKNVVNQFRRYFTTDQKTKLELLAESSNDTIYQLFQQWKTDSDLNGLIQKMISLTIEQQTYSRKESQQSESSEIELQIDQLVKEGLLKIDEFIVEKIQQRKNEPIIQGFVEYFKSTQNKEDLAENIRLFGRIIQKQCIFDVIEDLGREFDWSTQKRDKMIIATKVEQPILLGAFSVYFRCPLNEKEMEKLELLDTLNRFFD